MYCIGSFGIIKANTTTVIIQNNLLISISQIKKSLDSLRIKVVVFHLLNPWVLDPKCTHIINDNKGGKAAKGIKTEYYKTEL